MSEVSVVIPTYNRAHMLTDAINSALHQTYPPVEILVVDDGSTDETSRLFEEIVRGFPPHIIGRLLRQDNKGGNAARNLGVSEARGDWIAFLDSDDVWSPHKLHAQMHALKANPNAVACYCGLREVAYPSGEILRDERRNMPSGNLSSRLLICDETAPTSAYLVSKAALTEAGLFDEALDARQDWDLWIRLAQSGDILAVAENLLDMRHHDGPRTFTDPDREIRAYNMIRTKYHSLLSQQDWHVRARAKAAYFRRLGRVASNYKGKTISAAVYHLRSLICWPFSFNSIAALTGLLLHKSLRSRLRLMWNSVFGHTPLGLRSH